MSALRKCLSRAVCKNIIEFSCYRKCYANRAVSLTELVRCASNTGNDNNNHSKESRTCDYKDCFDNSVNDDDDDCVHKTYSIEDNNNHRTISEEANASVISANKSSVNKPFSTNTNEFSFPKMEENEVEKEESEKKIEEKEEEEEESENTNNIERNACHTSSTSNELIVRINKEKATSQRTKPIILRSSKNNNHAYKIGNSHTENNISNRESCDANSFVRSEPDCASNNFTHKDGKKLHGTTTTSEHAEHRIFNECYIENVIQADRKTVVANQNVETSRSNADLFEILSSHQENCERQRRIINVSGSINGDDNSDGPQRTISLWSSDELVNNTETTVDFRKMDEIETEMLEEIQNPQDALIVHNEENEWKHKLMFLYKFKKTPKHLTWKELGQEIECVDCIIEPDTHRPEEMYTITFYFINKQTGTRDVMWSTRNDVAYSEGLTDLLAAVGTCLGRSEVHRTIRFDDGIGVTRDVSIRKASRFTSEIVLAFRPAETYDKYTRKEEMNEYEASMEAAGMSMWGFHPELMNPEYNNLDFKDPPGTYTITLSAHSFSFILLCAMKRLLQRPMRDFYRPSQVARVATITDREEIGIAYAVKGWLGIDKPFYPHLTSIEAVQDHWLGRDAPFTLCAIINKLREMTYLQKENPEFQSWLSLRYQSTRIALRNIHVKLLGVGASTLFLPTQHSTTVNKLLPRTQQRKLFASFSVNAMLGLPDETRRLGEFRQLTEHPYLADKSSNENESKNKKDNIIFSSSDSGDIDDSCKLSETTIANANGK